MTWINNCPVDGTQLEFFGISKKGLGTRDPESGEPLFETLRWQECPKSHWLGQDIDTGKTIQVLKQEPDKKFFKVAKDD